VSVPVQELLAEGRTALRAGDARAHVARWRTSRAGARRALAHVARWSASAPERSPAM
jgi:hypothetical protein